MQSKGERSLSSRMRQVHWNPGSCCLRRRMSRISLPVDPLKIRQSAMDGHRHVLSVGTATILCDLIPVVFRTGGALLYKTSFSLGAHKLK
uniref:Uncharacterized protein n=1 Tax=Anguilla anguilla TaxID=7936 RepID=A0A0E9QD15_ANGAN